MIHSLYSWRPLGELLVEKGLLTSSELEAALAEQKRSGRLIGEILVESGSLSAFSLARVLTEQHGVELQAAGTAEPDGSSRLRTAWRPLGKVLVEKGYLTKAELRRALAEQRESGGSRPTGGGLAGRGLSVRHLPRPRARRAKWSRAGSERPRRGDGAQDIGAGEGHLRGARGRLRTSLQDAGGCLRERQLPRGGRLRGGVRRRRRSRRRRDPARGRPIARDSLDLQREPG